MGLVCRIRIGPIAPARGQPSPKPTFMFQLCQGLAVSFREDVGCLPRAGGPDHKAGLGQLHRDIADDQAVLFLFLFGELCEGWMSLSRGLALHAGRINIVSRLCQSFEQRRGQFEPLHQADEPAAIHVQIQNRLSR